MDDASGTRGEDDDAVGEEDRLVDVVGDQDDAVLFAIPQGQQPGLQRDAVEGVQRTERLVQQEQPALGEHRTEECHALAHAARELGRISILEPGQAELREAVPCRLAGPPLRDAMNFQGEGGVIQCGSPRHQQVALAHVGGMAQPLAGGEHLAVDRDIAIRLREQPSNDVQQGALAAAGRADQGDEFTVVDGERDIVEGLQRLTVFFIKGRHM